MVDRNEAGELEAFAFVLEQNLSAVAFEEEFSVNEQWAESMVSVQELEDMLEVVQFPAVVKGADKANDPIAEEIARAAGATSAKARPAAPRRRESPRKGTP